MGQKTEGGFFMKNAGRRISSVMIASLAAVMLLTVPGILDAKIRTFDIDVPFAFHAGKGVLDAGKYRVKEVGASAMELIDQNGKRWVVLSNTIPNAKPIKGGSLTFNRYDNSYYLSEFRWESTAREAIKSPAELELSKNLSPKRVIRSARGQ
jgi:hypothetical protein